MTEFGDQYKTSVTRNNFQLFEKQSNVSYMLGRSLVRVLFSSKGSLMKATVHLLIKPYVCYKFSLKSILRGNINLA